VIVSPVRSVVTLIRSSPSPRSIPLPAPLNGLTPPPLFR